MDSLGRRLLRVVLVPLGYLVAVVVGTLVIVFGSWRLGEAAAHPDAHVFVMFGFMFAAPVLLVTLLSRLLEAGIPPRCARGAAGGLTSAGNPLGNLP